MALVFCTMKRLCSPIYWSLRQYRRHAGKTTIFRQAHQHPESTASYVDLASFEECRSTNPDQMLTLHSHANAHCIMKVLKGRLTETRFATPTDEDIQNKRPMTKIRETTYSENQVTYMADNLGTHRISNPDPTDYAVSLHRKPWTVNLGIKLLAN
jgi:hypothetical protein